LRAWEEQFGAMAHRRVRALSVGRPIDLLSGFFKPWSLKVAVVAAEVPAEEKRTSGGSGARCSSRPALRFRH